MKKNIFLVFFLTITCAYTIFAQDTMHTILKLSKPKYFGVYVAPEYQYAQAASTFNSYTGCSAMMIFNKKFAAGITANHSAQRAFSPSSVSPLYLRSSFGGLKLEYTVKPNSALHVSFPLVLGFGRAQADSISYTRNTNDSLGHFGPHGGKDFRNNRGINSNYFVVQPGVLLEASVARCVKVFAGVNYRLAFATETVAAPLTKSTLNGLGITVGAKVGLFDFDLSKKRHFGPHWHHRKPKGDRE